MIGSDKLLDELGYAGSPFYRRTDGDLDPGTAHLFRAARDAGVEGIYVFRAGRAPSLAPRPAVFVADVADREAARRLHRRLWNLSFAPFIIARLPDQLRVYTGFAYSQDAEEDGLIARARSRQEVVNLLAELSADAVNSGQVWRSDVAKHLDADKRVDKRLLRSLAQLRCALAAEGLEAGLAHALIGKYVYLSYLWDRGILNDEWMQTRCIDPKSVFSDRACVSGLRELVEALEDRFNGRVFPIDFARETTLADRHVALVASVFSGAEIQKGAPRTVRQLHLRFQAYDFRYLPVETLSAIYEQFIADPKAKGAVYTPEILADYVLSEVETVAPLRRRMKVLDPACGSGVFLVLAYRRLIEKEMAHLGRKLTPDELRDILLESIWGVERERDACHVTEFSLILTLLHYVDPDEVHRLESRFFPPLHNERIFHSDFFDLEGEASEASFWRSAPRFDCIVGNPPWIELGPKTKGEKFVRAWLADPANKTERPVAGNRVAETFSWAVCDLLEQDGIIGLVLPATGLFNHESRHYRRRFFEVHDVLRLTNFANLRDVLFDGRTTYPAATVVYRPVVDPEDKPPITHYAPLGVDQPSGPDTRPWALTVNEGEVQSLSPYEAAKGDGLLWKLALYGSPLDRRALERMERLFPNTLSGVCKARRWAFCEGPQLRSATEYKAKGKLDELEHVPELEGQKELSADRMRESAHRFSVPGDVLEEITADRSWIRKRGGKKGLTLTPAPHLVLSPTGMRYVAFSEQDFVIPPRTMGIAASHEDADHLRALSAYLSSCLVSYWVFFHVAEWGVFRQAKRVSLGVVKGLPTPELSAEQLRQLADLQVHLAKAEAQGLSELCAELAAQQPVELPFEDHPQAQGQVVEEAGLPASGKAREYFDRRVAELHTRLQSKVDEAVFRILDVPRDIATLVRDLMEVRLALDSPSGAAIVTRKPTKKELLAYARALRNELDGFAVGSVHHRVEITYGDALIECTVTMTDASRPVAVRGDDVRAGDKTFRDVMATVDSATRERVSQWVYVQRGLRVFDGPRVLLYKRARLIDWTRSQALNDAGDIIGEAITTA